MKIGFFDSGKGAHFVAEHFHTNFPKYDYLVMDDKDNVPYGEKTDRELQRLLELHIRKLFEQDCALVVVACNTLSVKTVRFIQDTLVNREFPDRKVLGIVVPTIETLAARKDESFLFLATLGTVASGRYQRELAQVVSSDSFTCVPVSGLALAIEQGNITDAETLVTQIIDREIAHKNYTTIVLACTHYIALKDFLREKYPRHIILSQDEIVTRHLKTYLGNHPEIEEKVLI